MRKNYCKCGKQKDIRAKKCRECHNLKLKENPSSNSNYKHGNATKSGTTNEYMIWSSMLQRCNNTKNKGYVNYGGRGIFVCEEWLSFSNFIRDMGKKPDGFAIDRIDNDDGYYKENCKWVNYTDSNKNRRKIFKNKTSKYKGVYWHKRDKKWCVSLKVNGKQKYLGYFLTEIEAHEKYQKYIKQCLDVIN